MTEHDNDEQPLDSTRHRGSPGWRFPDRAVDLAWALAS